MKNHKSLRKQISSSSSRLVGQKRLIKFLYFLLFAVIGSVLLIKVLAANPTASIDIGSNSSVTSPAQRITNATALGGSAVKFSAASATGTGEFRIVGRDIVDPNGNKYFPIGANVSVKVIDVQYIFEGNTGTSTGHSSDVQAWGWNTVRADMLCVKDTPTKQQIYSGLDTFIQEYTAKKIAVIIMCGDILAPPTGNGADTNLLANQYIPKLQTFWTDMANKYKNNPYVWFNTAGEPMGWSGGDWHNWYNYQASFYNLIRSTGAKNIFVADVPFWAQDLNFLANDPAKIDWAKSRCNVLMSTHNYNDVGTYTEVGQYFKKITDSGIPLLIGEFGVDLRPDHYEQSRIDAADATIDFGRQYGIGSLWWHANGDTNTEVWSSLKNWGHPVSGGAAFFVDGNANNLSPYGQKFWNLSHNPPTLGKFTGNYVDSHCN